MKKKSGRLFLLVGLLACLFGCSGEGAGLFKRSNENEEQKFNLYDEVWSNHGVTLAGEYYEAIYGEEGALVWKKVAATFDTEEHYLLAFVSDRIVTDRMVVMDAEKGIYRTGWLRWYDLAHIDFWIESAGDDMFEVHCMDMIEEVTIFINGKSMTNFSVWTMGLAETQGHSDEYKLDRVERMNRYNNGKAVMKVVYEHEKGRSARISNKESYVWVDKYGNTSKINMDKVDFSSYYESVSYDGSSYWTGDMGPYSDGLVYFRGIFYDYNMNPVLDISNKGYRAYTEKDLYAPEFKNGVCTMIAYKNGSFWIFDINKQGETITEPEAFEILSLSY